MTSMSKKIPFPLVLVEWKDHYTNDAWMPVRDMSMAPEMCLTVGWLVRDAEDHVLVTSCIGPSDPEKDVMGGTWYILKNCITSMKVLRKGKNEKAKVVSD